MKNRIASAFSKLYGNLGAAQDCVARTETNLGVPRELRRLFGRELKRINAIVAALPDLRAKVVGIITKQERPTTILLQVRVLPSGRSARPLGELKSALARDPLLRKVRLILFKRPPKPKRP